MDPYVIPQPIPSKRTLVEYDALRVGYRGTLGLLVAFGWVATAHGYSRSSTVACSGGWKEAALFLALLVSAMAIIEILHWSVWRIGHRKAILPFEKRQALMGRATGSSEEQPKDYDLVLSGGRLALAPVNPLLGLVFACTLLIFCGFGGVPSPCDVPVFTWRAVAGLFLCAYTFLMFGTILENQVRRD